MTGWAFILLVWLAGAPAPVQDASIYAVKRSDCEDMAADARRRYVIGKRHPVYGVPIAGIHAACLEIEKPPKGEDT